MNVPVQKLTRLQANRPFSQINMEQTSGKPEMKSMSDLQVGDLAYIPHQGEKQSILVTHKDGSDMSYIPVGRHGIKIFHFNGDYYKRTACEKWGDLSIVV